MNKGIVMEKHRCYTIVMQKDGAFQKALPIDDADIGAEVYFQLKETKMNLLFNQFSSRNKQVPVRLIAMTIMLFVLVMPFFFVMNSNETYAYVNIDINPSVELEVNEKLKVQSINPLNDDAKVLINQLSKYKGKELENVIDNIMNTSEKAGLLKNGKNMLVGVSYMLDSKKISVVDTVDKYFSDHKTDWKIATFKVPTEIRKQAKENKQTMNELMATSLAESQETDDVSEVDDTDRKEPVNEKEEAIINSFYNKNQNHSESASSKKSNGDETAQSAEKKDHEKKDQAKHSSELKGNNGEINSNGKNKGNEERKGNVKNDIAKENKGKAKEYQKHKHDKDNLNKHKNNKHKNNKNNENRGNKGNNGNGNYGNKGNNGD
ncbi:anti-sigma-I factor RsgI family protein [Virgibacillus sp. L01]|uniref:anti-sigma-I factor RsgI family protein n=1 Tax=Virgibacillus sp. L01 TaxID=3457429 RepID=UPI003FD21DF5